MLSTAESGNEETTLASTTIAAEPSNTESAKEETSLSSSTLAEESSTAEPGNESTIPPDTPDNNAAKKIRKKRRTIKNFLQKDIH